MPTVKNFEPRPKATEPFVHWCATDPNYTLSKTGKYWYSADKLTRFCNLPEEEHQQFRRMQYSGHSINSWCTKCSDATC